MEDKNQEKESQLGQMKVYKISEISALRKEVCDALSRLLEIESQMHSEKEKILKSKEFGDIITNWWFGHGAGISMLLLLIVTIIGGIVNWVKGVEIIVIPSLGLDVIFIIICAVIAWMSKQALKEQGISWADTEDENLVSKYLEYVLSKWDQENDTWKNLGIEKDQLENRIKVLNERISAIQKEIDGLNNVSAFLFNA